MFERKGVFQIPARHVEEDRLMEIALEAGAEDVRPAGDSFEVVCAPEAFQPVTEALEAAKIPTDSAELTRIAVNTVDLDGDSARSVLKLIEELEDNDDVQNVMANFNIPDELMAELSAG
jgi:transcriptional/translational regulatory protein YebC/TACO1